MYFASEVLPLYLDEDWDRGIKGYYLGVTSVATSGDYRYAALTSGDIAILEYLGTATELDLTVVELGGSITTIGGSAFAYATVERIVLPETLVTVQRGGFYHSALTSITIPASVEFIGTEAFADTPITFVTFASGSRLTVIEQSAFEGTKYLTASVTIPAAVTTLGRAIFRNSAVTGVRFESGTTVTEIPIEMFHGSALRSFEVPNSVTKICDGAFEATADLESVTYGESLTWLGARAFYQSGLKSFHIRKTLTVLEEFALVSLENLTAFSIDSDNPRYMVQNGLLLSKDASKLVVVPAGMTGSLTVPVSVEKIGYGAFEATALEAVLFDNNCNLLSIGYRAFFGAEKLTEITVPSSVVTIDYYAFAYAKNLKKVTFADGSQLKGIYEGAFYGCISLSDITVPDSIVEISDYAFYGCTNLKKLPISETSEVKGFYSYAFAYTGMTELTVPGSVIDIDDYAFLGSSLVKVTIPDTNAKELIIGIGAFEDCQIEEMTLPFSGDQLGGDRPWFGYIFGAGGYQANAAYVPTTIKKLSITRVDDGDWDAYFYHSCHYFSNLQEIVLPIGLTNIGPFAFEYCNTLTSIIIPEGVTSIQYYAFYKCSGLTNIALPDSVTQIGSCAFNNCSSLTGITIPNGIKSIDFAGCSSLTSITIPDGVESIRFTGCSSLTSVTIPDSVTVIDFWAFQNCSSLKHITLPSKLTSISYHAFYGCSSLTSINIPGSVTSIGTSAFEGCSSLYEVYNNSTLELFIGSSDNGYLAYYAKLIVDKYGNKTYQSEENDFTYIDTTDGFRFLHENGAYKLIAYLGGEDTVTLPEDINGNSYEIYKMRGIKNVFIPSTFTEINSYAFHNCSSLTSITIPNSVTSIGDAAFSGCGKLTDIAIPDSVISINFGAFYDCAATISFGENNPAFVEIYGVIYDKAKTQVVYTPDYVTEIVIPATVTSFNFKDHASIQKVFFEKNSMVTLIDAYAFYNCINLKSIVLPDGVTSIGEYAFYGCNSLTNIKLSNSVESIGIWAFAGCINLTSITLSESLASISDYAFFSCNSLTSITLPNGVESIGAWAFWCCSNLTNVILPDSVTSIGWNAFNACSNLINITIPDNVTSIGNETFRNCISLTSVTLPNSLKRIGDYAFENCSSLHVIYNNSDIELTIGSSNNGHIAYYAKLVVDKVGNKVYKVEGSDFTYIDTTDGFRFLHENGAYKLIAYLGGEDTVTLPEDINGNTYKIYKMRGVKNVFIPSTFTEINSCAFQNCSSLTSITIPNSVTSIGDSAFFYCGGLTSIVLPDSVTSIGEYAFHFCTSLTKITIGKGVEYVGEFAFETSACYCNKNNFVDGGFYAGKCLIKVDTSAKFLAVREGTTAIASDAFAECYKLKHLTIGGNHSGVLQQLTNLETLVITEMPDRICDYFYSVSDIPITLTNIVLAKGIRMNQDAFYGITGVTIYVEANEKDVKWDANYPGWSNGNRVVYGDDWITANFYDQNGALLSSEIFLTLQVIRQPYLELDSDEQYTYVLGGWDLDGDGIADTVPATSTTDIIAHPIVEKVLNRYTVSFYDKDGVTILHSETLPYGSAVTLPKAPTKQGYTFLGWSGYTDGMTVTGDLRFYSAWSHNGNGHLYAEPVWVDATCTVGGHYKHTCTICGEWYGTDYTDALGHSYSKVTVPPTCEADGYDLHTCVCGDSYKDNFTEAAGHPYGAWIVDVAATCTTDGSQHRDCACGHTEYAVLEATGHTYTASVTKEATCTAVGEMTYVCLCGHTVTEELPATEHHYVKVYTDESFIQWLIRLILNIFFGYDDGQPYYIKCTECGHIATSGEVSMVYSASASAMSTCAHTPGDWTIVSAATCTTSEIEGKICSKCNKTVEYREAAPAIGIHVYTAVVTAPTCTEKGYTTHTCACGHSYVDTYVSATGHAYGEWGTVTEATCTKDGEKRRDCDSCDHYETAVISAKGHDYTSVVTAPTCTAQGYTTYTCTCGHSYVGNYASPVGHSYTKAVTKEATASEYGIITYSCQCGNSYTEQIEKLPPTIINRSETTWNQKSNASLTFRSDASIEDFVEVQLNGIVLDPAYYSVREGSTIVEIAADYLATLEVGEYCISIVSTTGIAQESFCIEGAGGGSNIAVYIVCACVFLAVFGGGCVVFLQRRRRQKT